MIQKIYHESHRGLGENLPESRDSSERAFQKNKTRNTSSKESSGQTNERECYNQKERRKERKILLQLQEQESHRLSV